MHNNYYFLRQLSPAIGRQIIDFTWVSCFSQNKDELIIEFNNGARSFFIKASLQPEFQCLSFPHTFHRARKNSIDLFRGLLMLQVIGMRQYLNERSFAILLEQDHAVIFKMHGTMANIIWHHEGHVKEIFRNNFQGDLELDLLKLDREIDWSYEHFQLHTGQPEDLYPAFGKPIWNYLREQHYVTLSLEAQWSLLQDTLKYLENPRYFIQEQDDSVSFSLFLSTHDSGGFTDPVDALREFFMRKTSTSGYLKEKASLLSYVNGKIKQAESFIRKNRQKLDELVHDVNYQQWADLVMANLHNILPGQEQIVVENFYDNHKPVEIKLKKEFNPQKNAEIFYRKAKNRVIELNTLNASLERKEKEIQQFREWQKDIQSASDSAALKKIDGTILKPATGKLAIKSLPYHEYEFKGFAIRVGKNAAANDTLMLRHSYKEDLWLHAKDVAGSHVLIKYQSGKQFPKDVIACAAGLAAYYSRRKNEKLCPVAVTPRKFVRKRKGDPSGVVVVEREEVILVEPIRNTGNRQANDSVKNKIKKLPESPG